MRLNGILWVFSGFYGDTMRCSSWVCFMDAMWFYGQKFKCNKTDKIVEICPTKMEENRLKWWLNQTSSWGYGIWWGYPGDITDHQGVVRAMYSTNTLFFGAKFNHIPLRDLRHRGWLLSPHNIKKDGEMNDSKKNNDSDNECLPPAIKRGVLENPAV